MKKHLFLQASCLSILLCTAHEGRGEELRTTLAPVVVTASGDANGTLTVPSNQQAIDTINQTAGGVDVVTSEVFEDTYSLNFQDTLAQVPGVFAQKRFGEEVRLSIRGSGLSRGFHLRGITLLQDGIPYNLADGGGDFQEADTLALQRLEVFKGGNALQYGGTTLGGAVNMVTRTGVSHEGDRIRLEGGSFDTYRANLQSGRVFEGGDSFVSLTGTSSEGFRAHEAQENLKLNGNIGVQLNDTTETRFYLSTNIINQELPGTVSRSQALRQRRSANPQAITQDWQRDIRSVRFANKTTFDISETNSLDVGAFVNLKDLFHPISAFVGVIDQESVDYGVYSQLYGNYALAGYDNDYRVGITTQFGSTDAKVYQNIRGSRGALRGDAEQTADNVVLYGENRFYLDDEWSLIGGAQALYANREVDDALLPTRSDADSFTAINPKIGVMYEPAEQLQFFANVSRSYEPPTFSELTQGGATGFTPVDAQQAWTAEIGSRGEAGRFNWDVALYRAWIESEMLQFTPAPGIPAGTFNAQDTIHQGIEAGLGILLAEHLFAEGDGLNWQHSYSFNDFFFDDDRQFADNTIAGIPAHFYQTSLRYDHADGWDVALNGEFASNADVDFANTLQAPGYGILGFNAGVDITENLRLFVDGRNLLDKRYISTFSTLADARSGNTQVFYPAEGRRFFAGLTAEF